jgi:hypothetical protein
MKNKIIFGALIVVATIVVLKKDPLGLATKIGSF